MSVRAFLLIHTEVKTSGSVAAKAREIDGVISADTVTGPYDVVAVAEADTMDDLGRMVLSRLQMIDGITRTTTCSVVNL